MSQYASLQRPELIVFWERMNGLISQSGFGPDFLSGNSTGKRMLPQLRTLVLLKQTIFFSLYDIHEQEF